MAVDIFLKLSNGISGESKDQKHQGEIDVLAWSWGASQSGTTHMGGGGGGGKVSVNDLSITKYIDASSADLWKACCNGTHLTNGTLTVRKAGQTPLEFWVIDFQELLVAGLSTGGTGSDDRPTEHLTLNFREFHMKYQKQQDDGSGAAAGDTKWDIAQNAEA